MIRCELYGMLTVNSQRTIMRAVWEVRRPEMSS
jgi:hypothetical protein